MRVSVEHRTMKRVGTHVKSRDHLGESETVLAEHFQRLELLVIRPILEFQSNLVNACSRQGQLQSNSRGVVGCVGSVKGRSISYRFLTNSGYLGVGHRSISDVEQTDERLVVDLCQR
jgi:hypothetical protein